MDWVLIQLGTNDVFSATSDGAAVSAAQAAFVRMDTLITSIKASDANTKVGLVIAPPPSFDQDSFGANYGAGQTRWRFKRNILIWARDLIAKYQGQEALRVFIVPSNTALDTLNNMSRASSAPVNSRSAVTSTRQNNGLHPVTSGYQQIADAIWAFLKYQA
jgi:lysophospholipase L1-like esterase